MEPTWPCSPASRAGAADIHSASSLSEKPRLFARLRGFETLQRGRAWRVVCRDQVDQTVAQALPQRFAIGRAADRRSALEERGAVGDFFRCTVQIMRARLDRDRQALALG